MGISGNPILRTLEGLSGLTSTEVLSVENNPRLESLEGASSLREVSYFLEAQGNDSLRTIGLRALEVAGYIQIGYAECIDAGIPVVPHGNATLEEIDGFDSLVEYNELRIGGNPNLVSLEPLRETLQGSEGYMRIEANPQLPLAHIEDVIADLDVISYRTCENQDDPETCICLGPEP